MIYSKFKGLNHLAMMKFLFNYFRYSRWLKEPLENSALSMMDYALKDNMEHEFLDFKRDFFLNREFQRDKSKSEELTKDNIKTLLERYAVGFGNRRGGFLIVGIAQEKRSFYLQGINYKNIRRKKLIPFLKTESKRIKDELKIEMSFISLRIKYTEVFIFKFVEGVEKPHFTTGGKYFIRKNDQTIDLTKKLKT